MHGPIFLKKSAAFSCGGILQDDPGLRSFRDGMGRIVPTC